MVRRFIKPNSFRVWPPSLPRESSASRVELKNLREETNRRFEEVNKQITDLRGEMREMRGELRAELKNGVQSIVSQL